MDVIYDIFKFSFKIKIFLDQKVEYRLEMKILTIILPNKSFLIESNIDKLESPEDLTIKIL